MRFPRALVGLLSVSWLAAVSGEAGQIHDLAEQGDLEAVTILLQQSPELINASDDGGYAPLHKAAYNNQVAVARYLLSIGADVNARSNAGSVPLHGAAYGGYLETVQLLTENGADLNVRNNGGFTPLLSACAAGRTDVVRFLVDSGAEVKVANSSGWTALMYAAESQSPELCEFLIDQGCDVNVATEDGTSALARALWHANVPIVELLLDHGADVDASDSDGLTPLFFAEARRPKEIADLMLSRGRRFDMADGHGMTMLHYAAARGYLDHVKVIVEHGVDIDARCVAGRTALFYASIWGHNSVVSYLRENGADETTVPTSSPAGAYFGCTRPGKDPEVLAENLLLTPFAPHGILTFSPDGDEVIWCHHAMPIQAMWHMTMADGRWTQMEIAPFTDPATEYQDASPSFTADGRRIYFTSHRPAPGDSVRNEDADIWYVEKGPNGWGTPVHVGPPVSTDKGEYGCCVSRSGDIYFVGQGYDDSFGAGDIYVSERVNGEFTAPRNLGAAVNSDRQELDPAIAADESYLVFSSNRPHPDPGLNLFVSFRTKGGQWTEAVSFGQSVVSGQAWMPRITADGKYVIYQRSDNYYWFSTDAVEDLKRAVLGPEPDAEPTVRLVRSEQDFGPGNTREIVLADLDSDHDLDAVFSSGQVWLNDGRGSFAPRSTDMVYRGHGVAAGDVDGDSDIDILFACAPVTLFLNDGRANFSPSDQVLGDSTKGAFRACFLDLDRDDDLDVATIYGGDSSAVFVNDGHGQFSLSEYWVPSTACADLDNDGDIDFFLRDRGIGYKVLLNTGGWEFTESWSHADSSVDYGFVQFGDLDNDGDLDVVSTNGGNDNIYPTLVLSNDGTGRFEITDADLPPTRWGNTALGDLNGDGFLDALVTNFRLPNYVFLNNGQGKLIDTGLRWGGSAGNMITALGDLDGDGDLDAFVSDFEGGANQVWIND